MKHNHLIRGIVICMVLLLILFCVILATPTNAAEPIRTNRQNALHEAADILRAAGYAEDSEVIKALQSAWAQEQEDLQIIAKVIQNEADPQWCEWEHSVAVGAVVCNRVKSPYFQNTVKEVVEQPGQYLKSYTSDFSGVSYKSYEAAKAAMDGDHEVPDNAFWQDNKVQGVYIWKAFRVDTIYDFHSTTYICCGIPGVE